MAADSADVMTSVVRTGITNDRLDLILPRKLGGLSWEMSGGTGGW